MVEHVFTMNKTVRAANINVCAHQDSLVIGAQNKSMNAPTDLVIMVQRALIKLTLSNVNVQKDIWA